MSSYPRFTYHLIAVKDRFVTVVQDNRINGFQIQGWVTLDELNTVFRNIKYHLKENK